MAAAAPPRGIHGLRVAHLLSGDLWAGAEVATWHLCRALAERPEVSLEVVALNPGELASRLERAGIRVHVEAEAGRRFPALLRAVRGRLAGADLVHAHRYKENLLAALSGRPWLATQHGRPEPFRGAAALRASVADLANRCALRASARRAIAVSGEVEDWLVPRVGRERVARIPNGIADPFPAVKPPPWTERPLRVGLLGRLVPVKAFELAVDAAAACPGLELEIVGEGPERSALERRIRAAGAADRIRLLGHDPDPLPRVSRWRALLVTSLHEGSPIAVLEALALGTPVVSVPLRGVSEILEGRGGWLLPDRHPEHIGSVLEQRLRDEKEGARASQQARERYLDAFTSERCAEATLGVYEEVLGREPSGGA